MVIIPKGLVWSKKIGTELDTKEFQHSQVDPWVFSWALYGNVVVTMLYTSDDLLVAGATKRDEM